MWEVTQDRRDPLHSYRTPGPRGKHDLWRGATGIRPEAAVAIFFRWAAWSGCRLLWGGAA